MPDEAASWVHRGLTSSDVVDTALALALRAASQLLLDGATSLVHALGRHALAHRDTARVGRTHGMHATADLWGHRVADLALAEDRARTRLARAADEVALAKLSGPTGTYARITAEVEQQAAGLLGLPPVDVATQIVMRDRMAAWVCALALLASVCEAFALEVRHGQRSEVAELAEGVRDGQLGSSAMPHKRNPVTAEKICGLSRVAGLVLRGASVENRHGDVVTNGFLFDMARVFEDFVTAALREALADRGGYCVRQAGHHLDEHDAISIVPDFVRYAADGTPLGVADAKYKVEQPNADLYQMLAYCTALRLPQGHLVYAKGGAYTNSHRIRHAGVTIHQHAVELDQEPAGLLDDVGVLAGLLG